MPTLSVDTIAQSMMYDSIIKHGLALQPETLWDDDIRDHAAKYVKTML